MFSKTIKKLNSKKNIYMLIGIVSAIIFCYIYGVKILNPTYTDWLLQGGDLSQHYLGWKAYRISEWHFPIGMVDTLAYPGKTSIIFTDSIPIFAVIFKLLSPILPENFQYFGFWGIMCFVLQGLFAGKILSKYLKNSLIIIVSSILFVFTPVMIWRMYAHTALAGQWIILFGLDMVFDNKSYSNSKYMCLKVIIMGMLATLIHMYFVLMCGIIIVGLLINILLNYKNIKICTMLLILYLISVLITFAILGGFTLTGSLQDGGLGIYSFNLNGLFNPQGWSNFFKDIPLYGEGQYEGFAYLGAGCIFLFILSSICFVSDDRAKKYIYNNWKILISLITIIVVSTMVALSPVITINDKVIAEIKFPNFIISIWSVFRASGRIIWDTIYIIMLLSIIVILKTVNKKSIYIICSLSLIFQFYDIKSILIQKNNQFNKYYKYESLLSTSEFWNKIVANNGIKHIVYYSSVEENIMYSLTDWALGNNKTVNDFYFARSNSDIIEKNKKEIFDKLPRDTIFIFNDSERLNCLRYNLHYYDIDNLIVGYVDSISGFKEIDKHELYNHWSFGNNEYIENGEDTESGRCINPGGLSFGPYWKVPAGNYNIEVQGINISNGVDIDVYYRKGENHCDFSIDSRDDKTIKISVKLPTDVDDLEIVIRNNSDREVIMKEIVLKNGEQ